MFAVKWGWDSKHTTQQYQSPLFRSFLIFRNLYDIMTIELCCYVRIERGGTARLGVLFHLLAVLKEIPNFKLAKMSAGVQIVCEFFPYAELCSGNSVSLNHLLRSQST